MNKETSLTTTDPSPKYGELEAMERLEQITNKLYKGGIFPHINNAAAAFAVVQMGSELGVKPMMSLACTAIINGHLYPNTRMLRKVALEKGARFKILHTDSEKCIIQGTFMGQVATSEYTMQEASKFMIGKKNEKQSLADRDTYKNSPTEMLFWRCLRRCITYLGVADVDMSLMADVQTLEQEDPVIADMVHPTEDPAPNVINQNEIPQDTVKKSYEVVFLPLKPKVEKSLQEHGYVYTFKEDSDFLNFCAKHIPIHAKNIEWCKENREEAIETIFEKMIDHLGAPDALQEEVSA